jgi:diaminopimelate decarboxylase
MDYFRYQGDSLCAESVPLAQIAQQFGTPCYVYSKATLLRHYHAFDQAFAAHAHRICYAVKANSNLAVLNVLAQAGSGFDVVSEGELRRVLAAGGSAAKSVFSGVGKLASEIRFALQQGIGCLNIESVAELDRINQVALDLGVVAPIAVRVNPDVDAQTHPYISTGLKENKFGVDMQAAYQLYQRAASLPGIRVTGIACHIGSQLLTVTPFLEALNKLLALFDRLTAEGFAFEHLDLGGGLGVPYHHETLPVETPPSPADYVSALLQQLAPRNIPIHLEPGRAIAANAGLLLTQVEYLKTTQDKHFIVVDAAMNDLLRPSLYQAWQEIIPCQKNLPRESLLADVVGPVCETGDFLGKARQLAVASGDLLAVRTAGAYGFVMSSNYNSRNRCAEVMVDGDQLHLVRRRETYEEQWASESCLPHNL